MLLILAIKLLSNNSFSLSMMTLSTTSTQQLQLQTPSTKFAFMFIVVSEITFENITGLSDAVKEYCHQKGCLKLFMYNFFAKPDREMEKQDGWCCNNCENQYISLCFMTHLKNKTQPISYGFSNFGLGSLTNIYLHFPRLYTKLKIASMPGAGQKDYISGLCLF